MRLDPEKKVKSWVISRSIYFETGAGFFRYYKLMRLNQSRTVMYFIAPHYCVSQRFLVRKHGPLGNRTRLPSAG